MLKRILAVALLFLLLSSALTYALMPYHFSEPLLGLSGNAIAEIVWDGKWLWAGTVDGVSRTSDGGLSWYTYNTKNGLSHNDVTAMATYDSVLWVALAYNKFHQGESYPFGGGFNKTTDYGNTWKRIEPPQATNAYYKLAFDLAIVDSVVWAACIYGGLIRFFDDNTWENVFVDSFAQQDFEEDNTGNNLNNIFFATAADTFSPDTLFMWTGTCAGIYKFVYTTSDSADTVINYNSLEDTLSGNFVFTLAIQKYDDKKVIWVGTRTDCDGGVFDACKSTDDGQTWEIISELEDYAVNNYDFQDSVVWAATNSGLKRSKDLGETWEVLNFMVDKDQPDQRVFSTEFYSVRVVEDTIWAGNADGLVKTTDDGETWKVYRSFVPIGEKGSETAYAYPNPFSPKLFTQVTRIHYKPETDGYVTIKIYDFAMNLVKEIQAGQRMGGKEYDEIWNGKNDQGDMVANGTYFFKLEAEGQTEWGKIVVIK
jgi:hypothetical protein